MAQELGAEQAAEIGNLHELCATQDAAPEDIDIDLTNNEVGRNLATKGGDCNSEYLTALNNGDLMVLQPLS
jgi:hypothetical protein